MRACPFCGSHDLDCDIDDESMGYTVTCMNCMADGPWVPATLLDGDDDEAKPYSPEELKGRAWELWNHRAPQEPNDV